MTFEALYIEFLMDPDRLRSARKQSEAEVTAHETERDAERGPYVSHHHHAERGESRH